MRSTATASSSEATTLSTPNSAMCTGGSVTVRSALPSLVTSMMVPVSAIARLAPLMPTEALMNFCRRDSRACACIASTVASVPNTRAASSLVRWIAGAMRWEGCVCVSCTIRSPRSVSTTSIPSDSRYGLSSISSLAIDLTLVTMGRCCPPAAFQQICPMMSRACAASRAKWTLPPTASRRSVNCCTSSGNRWRLARRRRLSSVRPASKSKSAKAASRRVRRPVIALVNAPCSLGSSRALLTRLAKWRRDSGTRLACFLDCLADRSLGRHRGQAYCSDANDGAVVAIWIEHDVWVRENRGARQLGVPGADLDHVLGPIKRPCERRRHQAVLAGEGGHRLEHTSGADQVRLLGIADELVQLDEGDRRDRVLDQRLDSFAQPAEPVPPSVVEVATKLGVGVCGLEVLGDVARDREPITGHPRLVRAHHSPESPDLVGQLSCDALAARKSGTRPVAVMEQPLEQGGRTLSQHRPLAAHGRVEVRDRQRRVPRGVDPPVDVGCGCTRACSGIQRVVVLVRILAARVETSDRIAEDAVEVSGRLIQLIAQSREGQCVDEACVVLEHLLEMRDAPILRCGVSEEPALDMVVGSTAGHPLERVHGHRAQLWVGSQLRLLEQKQDGVLLRKLGGGAKAAVLGVVSVLDRVEDFVDETVLERTRTAGHQRTSALFGFQYAIDDLRLMRVVVDGNLRERIGHLVRRQVSGSGEQLPGRGQKCGRGPATHVVTLVDIGSQVVVDSDGKVLAVDQVDDARVRVGRLVHDVAPVAPHR